MSELLSEEDALGCMGPEYTIDEYDTEYDVAMRLRAIANQRHKEAMKEIDKEEQRELLLAYEKYTSKMVTGKTNDRTAKILVDGFLANNCG